MRYYPFPGDTEMPWPNPSYPNSGPPAEHFLPDASLSQGPYIYLQRNETKRAHSISSPRLIGPISQGQFSVTVLKMALPTVAGDTSQPRWQIIDRLHVQQWDGSWPLEGLSRGQDVLASVIYCNSANDPNSKGLKTTNIYYLTVSMDQVSGCHLAGSSGSRSLKKVQSSHQLD